MVGSSAFQAWVIRNGGVERVAKKLDVSIHTVTCWVRRAGCPRVVMMKKIIAMSKGELNYEDIIESTYPGNERPKKAKDIIRAVKRRTFKDAGL